MSGKDISEWMEIDLNGPPYHQVEYVFDEYDIEGCALKYEDVS
jgi:hypothetical protein